jgi:hypothetical protein
METSTAVVQQDAPEFNVIQSDRANSMALITNDENMARATALAKTMASSKVTVPKHLQGNEGDCLAIIIQASNWGMNPFAVAQKTHLVNGVLGYEAQLVNAAVTTSNAISSPFSYEFKDDHGGVSCRVGAVLRGQSEITWGEWLNSNSVTTKNSPLWKTNVKQQMGYLQVKNWSRLYTPSSILGVYTPDEIELNEKPAQARPRNGAEYGRQAQEQQGRVIDAEQESRRAGLITALEAFAAKGSAVFLTQWKSIGKANRADAVLVGEPEYLRILEIAKEADFNQAPTVQDSFVDEMDQAETAQQGQA